MIWEIDNGRKRIATIELTSTTLELPAVMSLCQIIDDRFKYKLPVLIISPRTTPNEQRHDKTTSR